MLAMWGGFETIDGAVGETTSAIMRPHLHQLPASGTRLVPLAPIWLGFAVDTVLFAGLWAVFLLLLFVAVFLAAIAPDSPQVPRDAALIIAPQGALVDQLSGDPLERAIAKARGTPVQETLMKDLIDVIREAADDDRIEALVLSLDNMTGAGLSKLQELADEIVRFKESGKPVVAVGDTFTRNQ